MGFHINNVTVSGNLTRDPEQRQTPNGASITTIGIAHNERRRNQQSGEWEDRPHFFDVTIFGAQGEWLGRNARKGDPITVSGTLEQQRWQDKTSGENRSKVGILARDLFLGQRGGGGGQQGGGQQGGYESGGYGGQQGGGYGGGQGGYGGGQQGGSYGQAPPQREPQPAAAGYGQRAPEAPIDTSDFAPPRGGLSDPGEDDIPF